MHIRFITAAAVAVLALSGCAQSTTGAGSPADGTVDLRGEWVVSGASDADGSLELSDFPMTVVFTDGNARIRTGCYAYDTPMTHELDVQTASLVTGTLPQASCTALTPDEDRVSGALADVTEAQRDGDTLVLTGNDLEIDFDLVPAVASADLDGSWTLGSIVMSDVMMGIESGPTLSYADGEVTGTLGCDTFSGTLTPVSGNNTIENFEVKPSGDICTMEIKPGVEELTALLESTFVVHVTDDTVELISSTDDQRLIFQASV
jgi:hypothetical protein